MAAIRPETEIDRTQAALATHGTSLPLRRGDIEIAIGEAAAESPTGQRLLVTLVNQLSRMKGIVSRMHVVGAGEQFVTQGVPLTETRLAAGLSHLVESLNGPASELRAEIEFTATRAPAARIRIGAASGDGLAAGADGWRALLGDPAEESDWDASAPYGAVLAAALAGAELFKQLLAVNTGPDPARRPVREVSYSAFNYGVGTAAAPGPDVRSLRIEDAAVVGCGAGGTAALYALALQPGLSGTIALVEPDRHKLSNLNRYLMTDVSDVERSRHKLASVVDHLARFVPALHPVLCPQRWELLDSHPWEFLVSTVDTEEARWAIQRRAAASAQILDGSVLDLLYAMLRVVPGGWCLECKHPYDPDLALKKRAASWGQSMETIRGWEQRNVAVTSAMLTRLAHTQNRTVEGYAELEGVPFCEVPRLTECGETALRTDVPSQSPVLPITTTPLGALLAGEVAKRYVAPEAQLSNWLAHDLARAPDRPWIKWRPARASCPRHAA